MSAKTLHRRWIRRLEALQKTISTSFDQCRQAGDAESIHDLRVAIRRARLYSRVGRPLLRKGGLKRFDAWARVINSLLGPIRDCDVCLNWLASFPDSLDVVQVVHAYRHQLWWQASPVLQREKVSRTALPRFRKNSVNQAPKLEARLTKISNKMARAVAQGQFDGEDPNAPALHDLRRNLRRWRYVRELSLASRAYREDSVLAGMMKVQDALGVIQDLQMAMELLSELISAPECFKWIDRARSAQQHQFKLAQEESVRFQTNWMGNV